MFNKKYSNLFLFILYLFFDIAISYFFVIKIYLIAIGLVGLLLLVTIFFCKNLFKKIKAKSLLKILFWLTIITSFTGTAFLAIPFGSYHIFLFRILLPIILLLILIQILLNKGILNISCKKIKFYLLFFVFWLTYAILTITWANSTTIALKQIYFLFTGFIIIFLIILYIKKQKDFTNFYKLWIFITIGLLGIGLWEITTGNHLSTSGFVGENRDRFKFMPTGLFRNSNDLATFLGLTFPFIFAWLHYKKKIKNKIIGLAMFVSCFYILLATKSRANLIALILEILFLFFFLLNFRKKIKITIILVVVFIISFLFSPNIINKIGDQFDSQLSSLSPQYITTIDSNATRINLIKNSIYYLKKSYGFGVGAGNIESHISDSAIYFTHGTLNIHNWWFEILANYGIFMLLIYLLFYLSLIYNLWIIWHKKINIKEKIICESLLLSLIGFSIASVSSSSIMAFNPQWIIFGTSLAFLNYYKLKYNKNTV